MIPVLVDVPRLSALSFRIMVLTANAMFLVAIDPNKDKVEKKVKPFLYVLKRRIDFNKIGSLTLSTHISLSSIELTAQC